MLPCVQFGISRYVLGMPAFTKRLVASFIFAGTSREHDIVTTARASANLAADGSVGAPIRTIRA
jgi:hypothetical protein